MDRFLIAENPMNEGGTLALIHTIEPISIIGVLEGKHPNKNYGTVFYYQNEVYTLYIHHMFSTNMAGLDEATAQEMVDKLLKRAWFWFAAYLKWEDEQIDSQFN